MTKLYPISLLAFGLILLVLMWKAMQKEEAHQCNGKTQFYVAFGKPYPCPNWEQRND